MAKLHRRNHKKANNVVDQPVVESTPTPEIHTVENQEIPNESPVVVTTPVEPKPEKAKAKRYAPVSILANPKSTVTYVAPQYHKQGSLTHDKFALITQGHTIAEVEQAFVNAGKPRQKARNQLRWEFEHGKVQIEAPVEPAKVED